MKPYLHGTQSSCFLTQLFNTLQVHSPKFVIRYLNCSVSFLLFYQLDTSRGKCLRAWHKYTDRKRIQEERKLQADLHRRLARLKGGFQKWKKRVRCLCYLCIIVVSLGNCTLCKLNVIRSFPVLFQEEATSANRTMAKKGHW